MISLPVTGCTCLFARDDVPKLLGQMPRALALFILEQDFFFGAIDFNNATDDIERPKAIIATYIANAKL